MLDLRSPNLGRNLRWHCERRSICIVDASPLQSGQIKDIYALRLVITRPTAQRVVRYTSYRDHLPIGNKMAGVCKAGTGPFVKLDPREGRNRKHIHLVKKDISSSSPSVHVSDKSLVLSISSGGRQVNIL